MASSKTPIVDIHTHIYPPAYVSLLQSRSSIPYIRAFPPSKDLRLVILPAEENAGPTSRGRPIGPDYYDIASKIAFMDNHGIDVSVISLANPWLDWLPAGEAGAAAQNINNDIDSLCAQHPERLFFFAALPLSADAPSVLAEIERLASPAVKHVRGIILGTTGLGQGLDDPKLLPIFRALAAAKLPIFLHPHYGLPSDVWGPRNAEYGHVLPLALGFPLETTIAVTRMILADTFTLVPDLEVILAHSGGTLPFLAGRIESCIEHDGHLKREGKLGPGRKTVWEILKKNIYLDAVIYDKVGLKAAIDAAGGRDGQGSGVDRLLFGTDHPFFPPLDDEGEKGQQPQQWPSVEWNVRAVKGAVGEGTKEASDVLGGNAVRILKLF